MDITLSPVRGDEPLRASVKGDVLTLNGKRFSFAKLPEGAELPADAIASDLFCGPVRRINGVICLTLVLHHGPNAPDETRSPAAISCTSGTVPLPPYGSKGTSQ
tara:strand:- start:28713 stop:29024 length:312 start_codon:yes stop_codon:yes gene_type:complete